MAKLFKPQILRAWRYVIKMSLIPIDLNVSAIPKREVNWVLIKFKTNNLYLLKPAANWFDVILNQTGINGAAISLIASQVMLELTVKKFFNLTWFKN